MNTCAGPNRFLVLSVYAALVVAALVVVGCRALPGLEASSTGTPSPSAGAEPH